MRLSASLQEQCHGTARHRTGNGDDAAMLIECGAPDPFHSHSLTPPRREIGSEIPRGAAPSNAVASRKFDFPDPFGPMRTFCGSIGRSIPFGPKERSPDIFSLWINMPAPRLALHRASPRSRAVNAWAVFASRSC